MKPDHGTAFDIAGRVWRMGRVRRRSAGRWSWRDRVGEGWRELGMANYLLGNFTMAFIDFKSADQVQKAYRNRIT
jgi:hypothetical protein